MALVISNRKPWMLKDFLMDDIGSCSSTGFRSFPRRQCCVSVFHLVETELRAVSNSRRLSNAIQRASRAIFNVVVKKKKSLLQRSFSRNLFGKKEKTECEIERWISSGKAAEEKYQSSELSNETTITVTSASTNTNSDIWSESGSELTQPRSSVDENGVVSMSKRCVGGEESVKLATTKKKWSKEHEKEQLSPVSVLSFPDDDEDIKSSSSFRGGINHFEGTKEKLMRKLRRFEFLSKIGRIKLEPKLSLFTNDSEEKTEERMLSLLKPKTTSFNADNLLIAFFEEGLAKTNGKNQSLVEKTLLIEAEDWLCGRSNDEVSTSWKVKEKRKVYVKDMEEGVEWKTSNFHDFGKEEVSVQVEAEVFASLVDEMVEEFSNLELLTFLLK